MPESYNVMDSVVPYTEDNYEERHDDSTDRLSFEVLFTADEPIHIIHTHGIATDCRDPPHFKCSVCSIRYDSSSEHASEKRHSDQDDVTMYCGSIDDDLRRPRDREGSATRRGRRAGEGGVRSCPFMTGTGVDTCWL